MSLLYNLCHVYGVKIIVFCNVYGVIFSQFCNVYGVILTKAICYAAQTTAIKDLPFVLALQKTQA